MADSKLTSLTALTTPVRGDLLYVVDDPSGVPVSKRINIEDVLKGTHGPVIASSDAPTDWKKGADYICDGTEDESEIESALGALPSTGGIAFIAGANFNLTSLTLPAKPFTLAGFGAASNDEAKWATRLNFTFSGAGNCIVPSNDQYPQIFKNFGIYGDGTNTGYGIYLQGSLSFKQFYNISIKNVATAGVRGDSGNSQNVFWRVFTHNLARGFDMFSNNNEYYYCTATRSSAAGVGENPGFRISETQSVYFGCFSERNNVGYDFQAYCQGVTLLGCSSERCNSGLQFSASAPNQPKGCSVFGGSTQISQHATNAAVMIARSDGTTIAGHNIMTSTSDKAISISTLATDVNIIGGYTDDTTPITDAGGTRVYVQGFSPYVAQNEGAAANISDGGTIAHGLSAVPTVAIVSGSVAGEIVTVSGLDGTNITVAIKDNDGTPGTSQTIYWWAWI